jgi:hypothetical protein
MRTKFDVYVLILIKEFLKYINKRKQANTFPVRNNPL